MENSQKMETEAKANTESTVEPIEKPKWNKQVSFNSLTDTMKSVYIKKYNKYEEALDIVDSKFFVSQICGKSLIFREATTEEDLIGFSHNEFINHYGNKSTWKVVDEGKGLTLKKVCVVKEWKNHKKRRQYNLGIKFYPGQMSEQDTKNYYNSWRGFPIEGKNGEFPKIEYHLKHVWCRDDIEHYNYLIAWFADIIQNPAKKKGTALVVKGGKGTGKSIILEKLLKEIFGYTYIKIDKAEQITGKFNQHLQGKLFVVLEEAIWAGDKTAEGTLKSMITDTQFIIEGKGTNAEKSEAYFRMAFISNEKQAVPATADERRFFALKVSDEYRDNTEYFNELVYEIEHGGVASFMYHLQHLDISGINLRKAPRTAALFEDILAKMETIERFLYDLLQDAFYIAVPGKNTPIWEQKVTKQWMYDCFVEWEKSIMSKNIYLPKHDITTQTKFVQEVNKIMSFGSAKLGTQNGYILPSRDVARKMFESKVKCNIVWDDDESDVIESDEDKKKRESDEAFDGLLGNANM
jgi:hypothetical protein